MPSQFSNKREELCRHVKYYKGCLSCSAHETRIDLAEVSEPHHFCSYSSNKLWQATTQSTHRDETIKGLTALLQKPDLNRQEKNRLTEKQSKTEAQRAAWRERCDVVTEMLAFLEAGIKTICDRELVSIQLLERRTDVFQSLSRTNWLKLLRAMQTSAR